MKLVKQLLLAACISTLAACGGGGGGASSRSDDNPSTTSPVDTTDTRVAVALRNGDVSGLKAEDAGSLLDKAIAEATLRQQTQAAILKSIYGDKSAVTDLSLNIGTSSATIGLQTSTSATQFIVADGGAGIAAVGTYGGGRGMAYGADVLQWMAGSTAQQQHYPLFLRAFTWLMTGDGSGTLPTKIKYATAGYSAATVKSFITRTGKDSESVSCGIADPANTCWSDVDLLIFGGGATASSDLTALVQRYLAAGKPVIYMHPNWQQSAGGSQVLSAMGMTMGSYPGNYFASNSNVSVSSSRTVANALSLADHLSPLVGSLTMLKQPSLNIDLSADTSPTVPFKTMLAELGAQQEAGVDIFAGESSLLLHRLLVLWADTQRPTVVYGGVSRKNARSFMRTYATDAFLWFSRAHSTAAAAGQGDYMPASAQAIAPSSDWEELQITLPQTSGKTLIGRGALPGKGLQIEILDNAKTSSLGLQTSYLRSWGDPLTETGDTYARPMRPHSFSIPMGSGVTSFNSPNGGPLMLTYSGATADSKVRLRIKGVTRYAHFDYVAGMTDSDVAAAVASLGAGNYGWQTTKVVGGEIQLITAYAKNAIGSATPDYYANTLIRDGLFMSNHIANGYNDAGMTTNVASLCSTLGWNLRRQRAQHTVGSTLCRLDRHVRISVLGQPDRRGGRHWARLGVRARNGPQHRPACHAYHPGRHARLRRRM